MHQRRVSPFVLAGSLCLLALAAVAPRHAAAQVSTGPLPWVNQVVIGHPPAGCDTCPPVACAGRPIPVHVAGLFPDPCWSVKRVVLIPSPLTVIAPPTLRIVVDDGSCRAGPCPSVLTPWKADTLLPPLPAHFYALRVEIARVSCADSFPPDSVWTSDFPFLARADCAPADTLPYVDKVVIGKPPCVTCEPVVCDGEPFPVTLSGFIPNDCVAFRRLELVPVVNIRPGPPIVRAIFAVNDCLGRPCVDVASRWTATALLPGLPPGGNGLTVESVQVSMCDSTYEIAHDSAGFPFVVDSCNVTPPGRCLVQDWAPPAAPSGCNASFVNDTASVAMRVATPVALAGLQGVVHAGGDVAVEGLEPIGPAAGMTLTWTKRGHGAAFVMFAPAGAPIPPYSTAAADSVHFARVLRVHVARLPATAGAITGPTVGYVVADSLLGSDAAGGGVPMCLLRCADSVSVRCAPPIARFCVQSHCDVNHDGRSDVRDLVLMVRCLVPGGMCPDTTARYDCNQDGTFSLDDVLCCAWSILRGRQAPGTGGQADPSVALSFGEPRESGDVLDLPITLLGADRVGAARVALRFPADRYDVEDFGTQGTPPGWLVLHEVSGGELLVGLVATDPGANGATLPLHLTLRLRSGADHGGEVVARDAEVSATDGAALQTGIDGSGAVVDPASAVAFSSVGPNPAVGEARFTLSLPRAGDVDVSVHDLAGRRVATLQHGPLAAGVHPFTWNGRTDHGEAARDGVYFVRVRIGDVELARKTIFVRGR